MKLQFEIEMSKDLMNEGNKHDHWAELYRRNQARKHRLISIKPTIIENRAKMKFPIKIQLIRIAPRYADFDNLVYTCKSIKDFIADLLIPGLQPGRADSDELKLQWGYAQQQSKDKYYALGIIIEDSSKKN